MLLIKCPFCGPRPEIEFSYGGQAHIARPTDPMSLDDQSWAEYLYIRSNPKGVHAERWRHINGCARFFNVRRDTITDEILVTYKIGESPENHSQGADRSTKGGAVQ
jgi:sarcosine oxidase, subunit delta